MAKRKRSTAKRRKTGRRPTRRAETSTSVEPLVTPETARKIGGVALLLVGLILLLSAFHLAGPFGRSLSHWTAQLFGWTSAALPVLFFWFGVLEFTPERSLRRHYVWGSLLTLVAVSALFHVFVKTDELAAAFDGRYGGLVGYGLSATTAYALGSLGSFLVFLALMVIGLMVMFHRLGRAEPETAEKPVAVPSTAVPAQPRQKTSSEPARWVGAVRRPAEPEFQPRVVDTEWERPPLSLLAEGVVEPDQGDTRQAGEIIETTLANFNITAKVEHINVGPTVTQYELRPEAGVKLNQITALQNDLALALAAHPIRIEAPIPGKSSVGIEVPNQRPATVRLRQLLASEQFRKGGTLPLALGLDVSGQSVVGDLTTMPHLLIAGATGSGKSVAINGILGSLLFTHSPKHLRLLLIDPKRVELTSYNDIPHLLAPVVVEPTKAVNALRWVVSEMDRRYQLFQQRRVKDLAGYNKQFTGEALPYLVIVIDELADLMTVSGKQVEATIVRIAQMARATGIHLVLATQRPSVDVITGLIKANFPTRIAFTVTSQTDARTILDMGGAEKLLGQGDMLYLPPNLAKPVRLQGAYVTEPEVKKLTDFLKGKGGPSYDETVTDTKHGSGQASTGLGEGDDPLYEQAKAEVVRSRKASASLLQRRLKVGYARAARLLDQLEENGIIGPGEGAKPREILIELEDLDSR